MNIDEITELACHLCRGECCKIYLPEHIPNNMWFEEWATFWEELFKDIDIPPFHDPLLSHLATEEGAIYRALLPEWVEIDRCQYCHPDTGCVIPREQRPDICLEYKCENIKV